MPTIKLAVISDLHVGLGARSKDLCPVPAANARKERWRYDKKGEGTYRQKFIEFAKNEVGAANYLVLPGDVTNRAHPEEVKIASDFVREAAAALQVPDDRIVFVPGNHDVDWSVYDANDRTGVKWGQRYDPIKHPQFCFEGILGRATGNMLAFPHFLAWDFPDLFVVGYNSCSHDSPVPEHDVHHGLADPAHMAALRHYLDSIGKPDGRARVFLVHHHPFDFSNPIPRTPEFSLMTNAEELLKVAHEYGFDILVHGHRHHPRFETHSTLTFPHLPVLCSGSFSVELDTEWAGTIDNQFHLVTIEGRAGKENQVFGKIMSWTNNRARGWIPSEESTSGIHHVIPFGSYVMPNELDATIRPFIEKQLATRDHVLWREIVQVFGNLQYLPLNSAIAAFRRIAQALGLQTMYETRKDLMIYKEPPHAS